VAYLRPALKTGRIELRVSCTVLRVVIENGQAVGVEYSQGGNKVVVRAKDVILSAGALHSPKILMHSGIGPAAQLQRHGIPVVVDAPEVGENLQDHPIVPLAAYAKGDVGYQKAAQGFGAIKTGLRYFITKDGPASGNGIETVSYWDPDDAAAEPTIQCYHVPIVSKDGLTPTGTRSGITFELVVLQPRSRGSVRLADADPTSMPLIDPNFMADEYDLSTAIKSIRSMREVMEQPSLKPLLDGEIVPGAALQTDQELGDWIKRTVTTMWHPAAWARTRARWSMHSCGSTACAACASSTPRSCPTSSVAIPMRRPRPWRAMVPSSSSRASPDWKRPVPGTGHSVLKGVSTCVFY
jgi:choline dehydrogenase-like flavoprotein